MDDGKVMGDQQQRHALVAHQIAQQVQNAGLGGHVQRRGRLIGDQQLGAQRNGHGDGDTLALPARKLMRIKPQRKAWCGQPDPVQPRACLSQRRVVVQPRVQAQDLGHLRADGHQRVQRRHRLLKDHADPLAPDGAKRPFRQREQVLPVQHHLARGAHVRRQQPDHRQRRQRFARAAFADQRGDAAGGQVQRDAMHQMLAAQRDAQIAGLDHLGLRRRGSSASRSPSPSRFSPSTVSRIASPGTTATCGASEIIVCASASIRPQLGVGGWAPSPT